MTGAPLELTGAQRGILDAQLLWPGNPAFVLAEYLELRGDIDAERWVRALRHMIADTEAQRIWVSGTGDQARQHIADPDEVPVELIDLTASPDPQAAAETLMRADYTTAADPFHGITTRHLVLRLSSDRVLWYHRAHHIALDGYGFALCARRTSTHYLRISAAADAVAHGPMQQHSVSVDAHAHHPDGPPDRGHRGADTGPDPAGVRGKSHTLADVVADDIAYRTGEKRTVDQAYWHTLLEQCPAPSLTDRPRMPGSDQLRVRRELTSWAPIPGVRFGTAELILAAVAVYVARRSGEAEVVLGVPMMNRLGSVAATVPAMVLNAIGLPIHPGPEKTVADIAGEIGATMRTARRHARYRHEELRRDLGRIGSHRRLFGPVVNLMPFDYDLGLPGVTVRAHNLTAGPVEDLSVNVYLRSGAAELCLDGNPGSYTRAELREHADTIAALIASAAADPTRTVGEVGYRVEEIQSPHPDRAPDPLWRLRAHSMIDPGTTVHPPDSVALADVIGERTLTGAQLLTAALDHSHRLHDIGVRPGDLVAVLPGDRFDDVVLILGIQLAGAGHAVLDATRPLAESLTLASELALVAVADNRGAGQPNSSDLASMSPVPVYSPHGDDHRPTENTSPAPYSEDDPAYVVFTSGSTGKPKGVRVGNRALAAFVADAVHRYGWDATDRVLQYGPLHADTSIEEIFVALAAGAAVITTTDRERRSVAALVAAAHRGAVTVLDLPTALWHELAEAVCAGAVALPKSLRQIIIGGEEVSAELVARWQRHSAVALVNSYGPSEATVVCAAGEVRADHDPRQPVALGRLFPRVGAALLIDDSGPRADRSGQLCLYGPTLANGYLSPDSEAGFRTLRIGGKYVRVFHTGDQIRVRDDGTLEYLGRTDDLVKIGGQRVHLGGIEEALRRCPGVTGAVVVRTGPLTLTGCVTTDELATPEWLAGLRNALRDELPPAWIPATVVAVDELPRNRNLKMDRIRIAAEVPAIENELDPRTALVLTVFREVLGNPDLSATDDLFNSGGTSMHTIALANRLTLALGIDVAVEAIFAHPTAATFAAQLPGSEANPAVGLSDSGATDVIAVRSIGGEQSPTPDLAAELTELLGTAHSLASGTADTNSPFIQPGGRVLLTGATGFFGAYLLATLLRDTDHEILALVRADSDTAARARLLRAATDTAAADAVANALASGRLIAIRGDCAAPELGTTSDHLANIAHILHSAAVISPLRSYASLRAANVESTARLARLATATGSGMTLISTVTASGPRGAIADPAHIPTGYAQSKCVAEHVITAAGPRRTAIIRLPRVLPAPGDRRTAHRDFLSTIAEAAVSIGAIPVTDLREPMVRADTAAGIVVDSLPRQSDCHRILDLVGIRQPLIRDVLAAGYELPLMPLAQWRARLAGASLEPQARQAAQVWCDIQLGGFDREWSSDHAVALPDVSAVDAARLLGFGRADPAQRSAGGSAACS